MIFAKGAVALYFKWMDTYSTKNEEIDRQHRKLFEIGGKIADLVLADDSYDHYDEIMGILEELKEYTIYHFGYEEGLLEKYGYKSLEPHKMEHAFFVKRLQKIQTNDIDALQKKVSLDLIAFLSDWISGHILDSDMGYRDCLKNLT